MEHELKIIFKLGDKNFSHSGIEVFLNEEKLSLIQNLSIKVDVNKFGGLPDIEINFVPVETIIKNNNLVRKFTDLHNLFIEIKRIRSNLYDLKKYINLKAFW